jgi:N-ethylmaleimide reductase
MSLFKPLRLGAFTLPNRICLAPLTRCRADPVTHAPNALMAAHYAARADAGLLIMEATVISEEARGFPNTPGCYSPAQVEGWRGVLSAIRAKGTGARAFLQLWHQGRTASRDLSGKDPIGPSAIAGWKTGFGGVGDACKEMSLDDIERVLKEYKHAAVCAAEAGFDGVEIHGANGYLPNQFLAMSSNTRTDAYGGDVPRRARFLLEATKAAISVFGADRVGVRISPASHWQDIHDEDPVATYKYVATQLNALNVAYIHVVEPRDTGLTSTPEEGSVDASLTGAAIRSFGYSGVILSAGGHSFASGTEYVEKGDADACVFGRWFISNPDLVRRFEILSKGGAVELNAYNRDTFYGGGAVGYNDYPLLDATSPQTGAGASSI